MIYKVGDKYISNVEYLGKCKTRNVKLHTWEGNTLQISNFTVLAVPLLSIELSSFPVNLELNLDCRYNTSVEDTYIPLITIKDILLDILKENNKIADTVTDIISFTSNLVEGYVYLTDFGNHSYQFYEYSPINNQPRWSPKTYFGDIVSEFGYFKHASLPRIIVYNIIYKEFEGRIAKYKRDGENVWIQILPISITGQRV